MSAEKILSHHSCLVLLVNYEIRVKIPGAKSYVSRSFYSYGSWGGDDNSFEVNTEGNIDIELDKSSYLQWRKAKILIQNTIQRKHAGNDWKTIKWFLTNT